MTTDVTTDVTQGGAAARVVLVRHGETEWSRTRRHTGSTDVALTEVGEQQAAALAPLLSTLQPTTVLTSPASRARATCALAGFADRAVVDPRLREWGYGEAEGRTTEEIRREVPGWSVWTHPTAGAEPLTEVAARTDAVIADLLEQPGTALVFAHAHLLRVLATRWCGRPAVDAQHLLLDPASISILGHEREERAIERWNLVVDRPL